MPNPAPGFDQHPNYSVVIERSSTRVQVHAGEVLVADSTTPLKLSESNLPQVWYLPLADVDQSLLERTDTSTYCPFKGRASYWSIRTHAGVTEDAIWTYEQPFDECAPLAGYVAFYPNKVRIHPDAQD